VHPAVVTDTNNRPKGVLDLVHALENMAHRGREASLDEVDSRSRQHAQNGPPLRPVSRLRFLRRPGDRT
jgi:hypothetical protein